MCVKVVACVVGTVCLRVAVAGVRVEAVSSALLVRALLSVCLLSVLLLLLLMHMLCAQKKRNQDRTSSPSPVHKHH